MRTPTRNPRHKVSNGGFVVWTHVMVHKEVLCRDTLKLGFVIIDGKFCRICYIWIKISKKDNWDLFDNFFLQGINVFPYFCAKVLFYFYSPFFPVDVFHAVNYLLFLSSCYFCIHQFRGIRFLLLPGWHHSKSFRGNLSSSILRTWAYQLCLSYKI